MATGGALPILNIYIDSRHKTRDSASNSDFIFQLTETISTPPNCVCYIDDIIIPHTWYGIEYYNNKLTCAESC